MLTLSLTTQHPNLSLQGSSDLSQPKEQTLWSPVHRARSPHFPESHLPSLGRGRMEGQRLVWAQDWYLWVWAQKEEELRKEEERKKALDARLRFEQERMEQERQEQEERERRYREREQQIEEHR